MNQKKTLKYTSVLKEAKSILNFGIKSFSLVPEHFYSPVEEIDKQILVTVLF